MKQPKYRTSYFLLVITFLLTACTQKYQDVNATINEAVFGFDDIYKSKQEILDLPYATTYVTIDDGAQIFMVLALAENSEQNPQLTQLKWLSSDYGMLTTQNGRLVKTLKLPNYNLAGILNQNTVDPLTIEGKKPNFLSWIGLYDWQPGYRYGYSADIEWRFISPTVISHTLGDKAVNYYQEKVVFPSLNKKFTNHYWLDKQTHKVVKTIQHLGPEMAKIEMTILKPYQEK